MLKGEAKAAYHREYMRKKRGLTDGSHKEVGLTGEGLTEKEELKTKLGRYLREHPEHLEKLQRVSGSLGKYGKDVWFMDHSMEEVGECIGRLPARW